MRRAPLRSPCRVVEGSTMLGMIILIGLLVAISLFDLAVWRWGVDSTDTWVDPGYT